MNAVSDHNPSSSPKEVRKVSWWWGDLDGIINASNTMDRNPQVKANRRTRRRRSWALHLLVHNTHDGGGLKK